MNNVRKYLENVRDTILYKEEVINNNLERLAELKISVESIGAMGTGERVQTTPNFDKIGDKLVRISELENRIDKMIDEENDYKERVKERIRTIGNKTFEDVLIERYIECHSDDYISTICGITPRGVRKRAVRALEEFEKICKKP